MYQLPKSFYLANCIETFVINQLENQKYHLIGYLYLLIKGRLFC